VEFFAKNLKTPAFLKKESPIFQLKKLENDQRMNVKNNNSVSSVLL